MVIVITKGLEIEHLQLGQLEVDVCTRGVVVKLQEGEIVLSSLNPPCQK